MDPRLIDVHALRKEMRKQDEKKQRDPDYDYDSPRIWVAYYWEEPSKSYRDGRWILAGFSRTKNLTLPSISEIRAALKIAPEAIVKLLDLQHAAKSGPPVKAPSSYNPYVERAWLHTSIRGAR